MRRHDGWKNPFIDVTIAGGDLGNDRTKIQEAFGLLSHKSVAFEAGADAMYPYAYQKGKEDGKKELLTELRKQGEHKDKEWVNDAFGLHTTGGGTLVFIPDEK